MNTVTQTAEKLHTVLEEVACQLGRDTKFIEREKNINGADFAQSLIFGFLQDPDVTNDGLAQVFSRREVSISGPGISQRFGERSAYFFREILYRIQEVMEDAKEEVVQTELLNRFSSVIIEDSSTITLPGCFDQIWKGWEGNKEVAKSAMKMFVQWDMSTGQIKGPEMTDGCRNDHLTPFDGEDLPAEALYLADLGFHSHKRLKAIAKGKRGERRYFVSRHHMQSNLYSRAGHKITLLGVVPRKIGEVREMTVLLGYQGIEVRLIIMRVPKEVADERRARIEEAAKDHKRKPTEETLQMADWLCVITNVPRSMISEEEALIFIRLRWQIERVFRLWKSDGKVDESRSKKPWRILTEIYAKLCAMLIQHWFIAHGCWDDPARSIIKAAQVMRKECNTIMIALYEGGLERTFHRILRAMKSGCRLNRRKKHPGTNQLLAEGLDWVIFLT